MKTYHLFVGLPRTGSTVLSSILNQNPDVYVASDTAMYEVLRAVKFEWYRTPTMIANPIEGQLDNLYQGILDSMWSHKNQSIIIDRNRAWGGSMEFAQQVFKKDIKVICTVRSLPDIMASFKHIYLPEVGPEYIDLELMNVWKYFVKEYVENVDSLRRYKNILIINYDDFCKTPDHYIQQIHSFLELPEHKYDLLNIQGDYQTKNIVPFGPEGMHKIRPKFEKINYSSKEVLGKELFDYFVDMQKNYKTAFKDT